MKKLLFLIILLYAVGCSNVGEYTPKSIMKKLHNSENLSGKYMGDIVDEFGKPYKVEDSIIIGGFNYRDLSIPFKDSLTVTFTYMRPLPKKYAPKINDVVIIMFIQDQYTLNTPMEALWTVDLVLN